MCLHLNICLHRTRCIERRSSIHVPIGISLHFRTVQAVEDTFLCKLWNCNAFDSGGSVPPSLQTIQETGTFQFSSHRRLAQKCPFQMADVQDGVICMSSCSLQMYCSIFKLCLVCIPVAAFVTGKITSTATNATASTNTNVNSNTDISNNTAATTTTVFSHFCINQQFYLSV